MNATKAEGANEGEESTTGSEDQDAKQHGAVDAYADLECTLHLRPGDSAAVERCQRRIRDRFEDLEGRFGTDSLSTERWYKRVSAPTSNQKEQRAVELFDELQATVDAVGGRLTPFFDQRENDSLLGLASTERVVVFPVACATIRRDGDLVGLYPCWLDGDHHSVGDCLDRLEAGEPVTNLA